MTAAVEQSERALCLARQALHRFAALTFVDPRAGAWERLRALAGSTLLAEAAELVRSEVRAANIELARGELSADRLDPAQVLDRLPPTAQALNDEYEAAFGLLVSGSCPPYETEYVNSKLVFQRSNGLADIAGFYRAFGLEPSAELPERHDHIVLELEFMAYVAGLEAGAASKRSALWRERADICTRAQRRFLAEHLAWWAPTLAHLLARQSRGGFYAAAAQFLAALIPAERALLAVPMPSLGEVKPTSIDRPEECEGCILPALANQSS
jgi:TorA maturation chaperone TorD